MKKMLLFLVMFCSTYGMLQTVNAQCNVYVLVNGQSPMQTYYAEDLPLVLSGEPTGGTFSGVAIQDSLFNPIYEELPSIFAIIYTLPDGCASFTVLDIMVNDEVLSTTAAISEQPSVFPNPFAQQLSLHLNDWATKVETINLYTVDGQLVHSFPPNHQDFIQINTAHLNLSNGRYILLLEGKEQRQALPLIRMSVD